MYGNVIDSIVASSNACRADEQGHEADYIGPDGLLMCGVCNQRRQSVIEFPCGIGKKIVPVMCRCDSERLEAENARIKAQEQQRRIDQMRRIGITSADYVAMTMAADDGTSPDMTALAARYVAKREEMLQENIGLLFHGGTGGGKTFWAAAIANAMIDNSMSAMVTTVPQLITAMAKDYESQKAYILEQLERVSFLVLDDIGFESQSGYRAEKLFEIVDARYRARRPLIITTNLSLEEITSPQQMEYQRVFDRIVEMCTPVYVNADGRRKAIAREKSNKARAILGL